MMLAAAEEPMTPMPNLLHARVTSPIAPAIPGSALILGLLLLRRP
jgi:hypothetical protein